MWCTLFQPKGMTTDFTAPVVLHDNAPSTEDFCNRLHKQLMMQFKYAWVWGSSVRHQPQKVTAASSPFFCSNITRTFSPFSVMIRADMNPEAITYQECALYLPLNAPKISSLAGHHYCPRRNHYDTNTQFLDFILSSAVRQRSHIGWRRCCPDRKENLIKPGRIQIVIKVTQ